MVTLLSALGAMGSGGIASLLSSLLHRAEIRRVAQAHQELQRAESELTGTDQLSLPELWEVTHKRLDYYHQIATGQARPSFRNAQIATAIGFTLLVVFAVLALNAPTTTASIVTGTLGAASVASAGYISRTFVRTQEAAARYLRTYFDQPLEFSRYLAAERLLTSTSQLTPEQWAEIIAELLRAVIVPAPAPGGRRTDHHRHRHPRHPRRSSQQGARRQPGRRAGQGAAGVTPPCNSTHPRRPGQLGRPPQWQPGVHQPRPGLHSPQAG